MNAVIPRPASAGTVTAGGDLAVSGHWRIHAADSGLTGVARTVGELLRPHLGARLVTPGPGGNPGDAPDPAVATLTLALDDTSPGPHRTPAGVCPRGGAVPVDESYRLTVDRQGMSCRAATPEGVFRAATTAVQLLTASGARIPCGQLTDAPHYAWRGLMVDPARGHLTPEELRRVVDLAALYKLNVLHLHLTDNEGWRIEVPSLPGLTSPAQDGTPRAHYTVEDYRALQRYAAERFVTVIPEVDLPGHCAALREALPELPAAPVPPGLAGRFPFVPPLDLADPVTREVVAAILADVCRLTDAPFVHIGGDEALGMTADSFALAVRELRSLVREAGKRPLGWQESARAGITPDDIAQFWVDVPMMDLPDTQDELDARPELLALGHTMEFIRALKAFFAPTGHDVTRVLDGGGRLLLSPQSHLYLDRPYAPGVVPSGRAEDAARLGFGSYRPRDIRHTAAWNPSSHAIPDARIAGIEATVFGESVEGFDDMTTLLLPRLASVADIAWTGRAAEWEDHRTRLAHHGRFWEERGLAYLASTEIAWL
ncbi:family 20 glycosylhydrolase [Streptomyces sp. B1I3]|uniref:family 20 glycosylhydrolase n=1 Tax=Streptomyces sp. B1I3 TaxID=3042264 RepID=UPI00277FFBEC|nr:family 20 glycosylhydrolase [Streptomyces sp. B1I3]MDQ0792369.1 hexosaminidase [Streptomyces sp. B1I3]